eukprot:CFRG0568T1
MSASPSKDTRIQQSGPGNSGDTISNANAKLPDLKRLTQLVQQRAVRDEIYIDSHGSPEEVPASEHGEIKRGITLPKRVVKSTPAKHANTSCRERSRGTNGIFTINSTIVSHLAWTLCFYLPWLCFIFMAHCFACTVIEYEDKDVAYTNERYSLHAYPNRQVLLLYYGIVSALTFCLAVSFIIFFYKFWSEPEIRCRLPSFVIHLSIVSFVYPIQSFLGQVVYLYHVQVNHVSLLIVANAVDFFTLSMLASSVVLRMRTMFIHLHGTCIRLNLAVILLEFFYYVGALRNASHWFVDYIALVRMVVMCTILLGIVAVLPELYPEGREITQYNCSILLIWTILFEMFGFVAVKMIFKSYNLPFTRDVPRVGKAFTFIDTQGMLEQVVMDDELFPLLLDIAENGFYEECIHFMKAVNTLLDISTSATNSKSGSQIVAEPGAAVDIDMILTSKLDDILCQYIMPEAPTPVNLPGYLVILLCSYHNQRVSTSTPMPNFTQRSTNSGLENSRTGLANSARPLSLSDSAYVSTVGLSESIISATEGVGNAEVNWVNVCVTLLRARTHVCQLLEGVGFLKSAESDPRIQEILMTREAARRLGIALETTNKEQGILPRV